MPGVTGSKPNIGQASDFAKMCVGIVSNTGLTMSIFLLCFHLLIFSIVDDLQNLPGKNLASFCVALILEYTSTLLSSVLEDEACYINEIAAYYFIMASAFWMLTMSYDVWQTLRSSTNGLLISSGRQCKKFIYYSLFSWLMPALLTTLVFFVLPRIFENFDLAYQDFDQKKCTFAQTDKMYVFVTTVFGTILLLNTLFFVCSIYYIFSTRLAVINRSNKNNAFLKQFQLYGRLAIIMGVTWTAEFIINYSKFDILSTTFKIVNTFEGFFIVIAFTMRKEVLESIRSLHISRSIQEGSMHFYRHVNLRELLEGKKEEENRKFIHTYPLIKASDMNDEMKAEAVETCVTACEKYSTNHEAAAKMIKETLDKKFGTAWHTVVGEGYGFEISYDCSSLLYVFFGGNVAVCTWKCS